MDKCPCKQCPCIAICRLRWFLDMKNQCSLVATYLFRDKWSMEKQEDFDYRVDMLREILRPVIWGKDQYD